MLLAKAWRVWHVAFAIPNLHEVRLDGREREYLDIDDFAEGVMS